MQCGGYVPLAGSGRSGSISSRSQLEAWTDQRESVRKQLESERTELEKQKSAVSALQSELEGRKMELEANERMLERKEQRLERQWQKKVVEPAVPHMKSRSWRVCAIQEQLVVSHRNNCVPGGCRHV